MSDDNKLQRCNEIPVVKHLSTGSGDCSGLENAKLKAGQTSDWTLPPAAFTAKNPTQDYWEDEQTELFITTEDGEFITLE